MFQPTHNGGFIGLSSGPSRHFNYPLKEKLDTSKRFHQAVLNNADVVKEMLDNGLDPNDKIFTGCWQDCCSGYTLLYSACVHDRMNVVKMLLAAGADPEKEFCDLSTFKCPTPFYYAIKNQNLLLMRMLLCENRVDYVPRDRPCSCDRDLHYGMFRHVHDIRVIKSIMEVGLSCIDVCTLGRSPAHPNLAIFLYTAAKYRSSELYEFFMDSFGAERVIDGLLKHTVRERSLMNEKNETLTMTYLIDLYEIRYFVDNDTLRCKILMFGSGGMLELMMGHFYQLYGDNKEWWTEQMVSGWTSCRDPVSIMHSCVDEIFKCFRKHRFVSLLSWGIYSVVRDLPSGQSVFFALAQLGSVESIRMFTRLYPQCLQEAWFLEGQKPWSGKIETDGEKMVEKYFADLVEKREHVPDLQVLCRSVIFHELGINPILKAERLPLPRKLKDFVQCKELF